MHVAVISASSVPIKCLPKRCLFTGAIGRTTDKGPVFLRTVIYDVRPILIIEGIVDQKIGRGISGKEKIGRHK